MSQLAAELVEGIEKLVMADVVVGGFAGDEGDGAGGFEVGVVDGCQGIDALLVGGGDEFGAGHHLFVEMIAKNAAFADEAVTASFDDPLDRLVAMNEADEEGVDEEKGGSAENTAGDGVVIADDGVLDGVGESEQDDEVERVELGEFAFAGYAQAKH